MNRLFFVFLTSLQVAASADLEIYKESGERRIHFGPKREGNNDSGGAIQFSLHKAMATMGPSGNLTVIIEGAVGNQLRHDVFVRKLDKTQTSIGEVKFLHSNGEFRPRFTPALGGSRRREFVLLSGRDVAGDDLKSFRDDAIVFFSYSYDIMLGGEAIAAFKDVADPLRVKLQFSYDCDVMIVGDSAVRSMTIRIPMEVDIERKSNSK